MSRGQALLRWSALGVALLLVGVTYHPTVGNATPRASATAQSQTGEPITGAEIYVELEYEGDPLATVRTGSQGEFTFTFPTGRAAPAKGTFVFRVVPPNSFATKRDLQDVKPVKLRVPFVLARDGPRFEYVLRWVKPSGKAQTKGAFAVSGKSASWVDRR